MIKNIIKNRTILLIGSTDLASKVIEDLISELKIAPPDVHHLHEPKIEHLRQLLNNVQLRPYQSHQSCLVLPNLQNWRLELLNALLKTLEEPPHHLVIILTTNDESAILETILSRVAKFYLGQTSMSTEESLLDLSSGLVDQFSQIKDLTEQLTPREILQSLLVDSTPAQQSFILNQLKQIGNAPVNKKLILEATCLELLILEGESEIGI